MPGGSGMASREHILISFVPNYHLFMLKLLHFVENVTFLTSIIDEFNFAINDLKTKLFWSHHYKFNRFLSGMLLIGVPKTRLNFESLSNMLQF